MKTQFIETLKNKLNQTPIIGGQVIYCTDKNEVYYDTSTFQRILYNQNVVILNKESERDSIIPSDNKLYIIKESHNIYVYYVDWICLNSVILEPTDDSILSSAIESVITIDGKQYSPKSLTSSIYNKFGVSLDDILKGKSDIKHQHDVNDIINFPNSLPANGGTSSFTEQLKNKPKINGTTFKGDTDINITADPNVHSHNISDINDFPDSMPANGGNADTVDNKSASDFAPSNFGLGEEFASNIIGQNVNSIYKGGLYYSNGGNTNAPEAGPFVLSVIGKPFILQTFFFVDTHNIYYRLYNDSKWTVINIARDIDIPNSLPANGGNSDRLGGLLADEYALKYSAGYLPATNQPADWNKGIYWSVIETNGYPCDNGKLITVKNKDNTIFQIVLDDKNNKLYTRSNNLDDLNAFSNFREIVYKDKIAKKLIFNKDISGSASIYENGDNINIDITVNKSATLTTPRNIKLDGDVLGNIDFDGSKNVNINTLLKDIIQPGTFFKVTTDKNGRIIKGENPDTLDGFGITDAVNESDVVTKATANKILKLDSNSKLPTSITGDSQSLQGKIPSDFAPSMFGLGEEFAIDISNTDVNSIYKGGLYYSNGGNTNAPETGPFVLSVIGKPFILQVFFFVSTNKIYYRVYNNSKWTLINVARYTDIPTKLPANGGNADTVDNKSASDFATSQQGLNADDALDKVSSIKGIIKNIDNGTAKVSSVSIPSDLNYNSTKDSLIVFLNRVLLFRTLDYTISSDNKTINCVNTDGWYSQGSNSVFTFILLKNVSLTIL